MFIFQVRIELILATTGISEQVKVFEPDQIVFS